MSGCIEVGRLTTSWPSNSGYYSDSCSNCGVTNSSTLYLTCECRDMAGSPLTSTFDLGMFNA